MELSRKNNWTLDVDDFSSTEEEIIEIETFEYEVNQKDVKMKQLITNLSKLGEQCQEILKLFWFENLRHDEIALRMNLSNAKTSKATKSRCQNKLKEMTIHVN
jgi:RNA polymerase sigma-70 factor (ECF subfamily)